MNPPRNPDEPGFDRSPRGAGEALALLTREPGTCTDGEIADAVLALRALSDRVDAAMAVWLGAFDGRTIWAGDGARTGAGWLTARTDVARSHAGGMIATARDLRACAAIEAAWRSGRLGTAKVRLLLRARRVHPDLFREHEAGLIDHIAPLTVAHAAITIARWEALAHAALEAERANGDGDGADPPADPAEDNSLQLSPTLDGRWMGDLNLDPTSGAELAGSIAAHIDRLFQQGTYQADDGLTPARRRADALVELALRGAHPDTTRHGDPRPSVSITIDHQTLAGIPPKDLEDGLSRTCQLDNGTPIPRSTAERLLCTARITPLLTALQTDGTIETLGTTEHLRDPTRRQRRALKTRDGGCAFTGCDAPADWCEAHHLTPHEIGGPTLLQNLVLLCRYHHHLVHEGGWNLHRSPDNQLHLHKPDGTPMPQTKHGTKIQPPNPPGSPPKRDQGV